MFSGKKLRELRKSKGLTLKKLAEKADLNWQQIQALETGIRTGLTAITLRKIALALDVSMDEFFEDEHLGQRPLGLILDGIEELAERRRLTLPKDIYPIYLFQEALGIADNEAFTNILLALARGRVIELIPVFARDTKEGMKVYQVPELGNKKYYSFTIVAPYASDK